MALIGVVGLVIGAIMLAVGVAVLALVREPEKQSAEPG